MRWITLTLAAAIVAAPAVIGDTSATKTAFESITKKDLLKHISYLASDELEGRAAGSKGCYLAGDYIAKQFKSYGLKGGGTDGTYFQNVPMGSSAGLGKNNSLSVKIDGQWVTTSVKRDFTPFPFSANKSASGEVVFAGYGIVAPEHKYDDYAGIDVKGKIVLIYRHEPRETVAGEAFLGKRNTRHAFFATKAKLAQDRGAIALLIVTDPANHQKDPLFGFRGQGDKSISLPVLHIKQRIARAIFKAAGKDLTKVQQGIDKNLAPNSFSTGIQVKLTSQLQTKSIIARNVLGLLEGSDPELKKEIVVIGGHYDHLGYGNFGSLGGARARNQIHNGADDNASGTSGVLEIAQAFHVAGIRPRRSILFMGFTGEERGLIGSKYYVNNPIHPLKNTVAMLNMDMIGRGKTGEFQVSGLGTSPVWSDLVRAVNTRLGTKVTFGQSGYAPSDNTSFFEKGIPVLFFFTGMHENYHRPSDDVQHINKDQIELVARYAFATLYYVADVLNERPKFTSTPRASRRRPAGGGGAFLGVQAGQGGGSDKGFLIGSVTPGTAAAKAGLKAGDVITHFDGKRTADIQALIRVIRSKKKGDAVVIKILRDGETLTVKAKLGGR